MLSDAHLKRHLIEIHERFRGAGDEGGGGHSGVSLNIYAGILGESPKRLVKIMSELTPKDGPAKELDMYSEKRYFKAKT